MGIKSRETKKKKNKKKGKMTGASREDKATISEEFMVTLKLNIQRNGMLLLSSLVVELQLWGVYAFRKATGSTR